MRTAVTALFRKQMFCRGIFLNIRKSKKGLYALSGFLIIVFGVVSEALRAFFIRAGKNGPWDFPNVLFGKEV